MAMAAVQGAGQLLSVVALLAGAVVAVPLYRRLRLGSVLGYFAAGLMLGPFGLGWFADPQAILHLAELGVVLSLFLIGLEMRPRHLWSLRRQIFGLGSAQIPGCTMVLTGICRIAGSSWPLAFIAAAGFVLTSTAVVMQWGGLSMAMGAFVAGVLLSESAFRHQLQTEIEPFRGLLLGLFFLGVGMALDLAVVAGQ